MNRNRGSWRKRLTAGDLFDRTRQRLTLQYSGMLIMFLSLFVIIVYAVLFVSIWSDQHARLNGLADSEIGILQQWADQDRDPYRRPPSNIENAFSISADQSFYYLLVNNGNLNLADEIQPELRDPVMAYIAEGRFADQRIETISLQTYVKPSADGQEGPKQAENATFVVTARELLWKGERIGSLYIGKEVTFQYDLFRWLLALLVGMALLFFVLALWLSHRMSRRAMIPIAGAYARQREFVADASHELRTPLSVLQTSIEALRLEESADRDSFATNVLGGMQAEVRSMTKLVGELLQLARSDSGDSVLTLAPFDPGETAAGAIAKLQPSAREKGIAIRLHAPAELTIRWDAEKLMQLLVLLLDNAVKYTPAQGSIDVTVADGMEKGTRFLTVAVKDSGIGIAAEALPRIFDRFYREDKSRTRQAGGHGLGLAIAKNIVDAGRGTIHADSAVGRGSTFTVRIPLHG